MSLGFAWFSSLSVAAMMAWWVGRTAETQRDRLLGWAGILFAMALTAAIGVSGILTDFTRLPPPFGFFVGGLVAYAVAVTLSPWGGRLCARSSLRVLVGLQGFRVLPEVLLFLAWREGLAPIQMTWHGRNLDIVTALTAIALAVVWPRLPRPRLWATAHTVLGMALLVNIVSVAILSAPTPFRVFMNEPANTFVAGMPYIWLPGVQVLTALDLHLLTIRKLCSDAGPDPRS